MCKQMKQYVLIILFLTMALIGEYVPQLDENGDKLPMQCWGSTGTCWCEDVAEKEIFRQVEKKLHWCPPKP